MNKDIKKSSKGQSKNENWDKGLQELTKKAKKAKKYFPGFAVKGQVQVYEQIVHELWNLNSSATKVLLFIARQTVGWGKDFDWITISQFQKGLQGKDKDKPYFKGVGLSKKAIIKALKELEETGYIIKKVICPECEREVPQIEKKVKGVTKEHKRKQVQARCPFCQSELLGNEMIYYGLHYKPTAYEPKRVEGVHSPECKKYTQGGVSKVHSQVSRGTSIKNHHPSQEEITTLPKGAPQASDDDDKTKKPEEKPSPSQAKDYGRSSHNQNARDARTLTDKAERVVKKFRQVFGQRRGLKKCTAELNEMVEIFGEQAFLDEIEKVVELEIKPSSMKYIMTCVMRKWDGACPACGGYGMNNTTPDGKCPLCKGRRHFNEYSELKRARSKMAK